MVDERKAPILVVDDDPNDAFLARRALAACAGEHPVLIAADGAEALDVVFHRGAHATSVAPAPALVLLDLRLPKVNGFAVLQQIRASETTRNIPVVIFTSSHRDEDLLRCYGLGTNSYLRKPTEHQAFVEALHALAVYWLRLNQAPAPS